MKYIILALLAFACIFIGYVFSLKYRKRAFFFKTLVMLCQKFDVEINFSRERVKNLLLSFDEKTKKNLQGLDKNYIDFLDNRCQLDDSSLFKNINFLKQEEKDVILLFFKSLGRSDLDSQSKELKNFEKRFDELASSAGGENKKYGGLSIKLGIIVGLLVFVLFC